MMRTDSSEDNSRARLNTTFTPRPHKQDLVHCIVPPALSMSSAESAPDMPEKNAETSSTPARTGKMVEGGTEGADLAEAPRELQARPHLERVPQHDHIAHEHL